MAGSLIRWVVALLLLVGASPLQTRGQKIPTGDLITKHLESIGTAKARESIQTRIITGTAQVIFRTEPTGQAIGKAVLASQQSKTLIGMSFPSAVYPREQFGFNGSSFVSAFVTPGVRSVLGSFLMTNDVVFKQGLIGGVLSASWPLAHVAERNPQVEYLGTRKIDDQTVYALRYIPRTGSDLKITLFFEPETFRHVRTEYERVIAAQMDTRSMTNVQTRESRYKLIEEFSLFKAEGELMLPHIYRIRLSVDTQSGTFLGEWIIKLTQFTFNEKIDPAAFSISAT